MSYRLQRAEARQAPGAEVLRIVYEQLDEAVKQLQQVRTSRQKRVHEARKAIKKTRSALRLVRAAVPEQAYQSAIDALRDVARSLAPFRDADVMRETAAALGRKAEAGPFQTQSKSKHRTAIAPVAAPLVALRATLASWPWDSITVNTLAKGFAKTVQRFNDAFHTATAAANGASQDDERFHDWRKRAKDLRYQCLLLEELWPAMLQAYAAAAEKVEEQLGEDHDLAVLLQHDSSVAAEATERQQQLRRKVQKLGHRLSVEDPKAWKRRIVRWFDL